MKQFGVIETALTSPPDRDGLVVELVVHDAGDSQIAEVRWQDNQHQIELYSRPDGHAWDIPLRDFLEALNFAVAILEDRLSH